MLYAVANRYMFTSWHSTARFVCLSILCTFGAQVRLTTAPSPVSAAANGRLLRSADDCTNKKNLFEGNWASVLPFAWALGGKRLHNKESKRVHVRASLGDKGCPLERLRVGERNQNIGLAFKFYIGMNIATLQFLMLAFF